jgi:putative ABC transport system permease protein
VGSRFRLLRRLSAANIRRHKWRWSLTTIGIAIGIASFAGILAISRSIIYAFEQSVVRTAGRAQLQVSNGTAGVSTELVESIAGVPGIEVASGNVQYEVTLPRLGRRLTIFGVLLGANHAYREAQFGMNALTLPDAGTFVVKPDSIALSDEILRERGWTLGSTVEIAGPKGPRTLVVRGIVHDRGALSVFNGDVGVMDAEAAQQAFGELDRYHWVDVVVAPGVSVETARLALERAIAGRAVIETPFGRGQRMEAMLGTLRWMLTASGTVSMLVGVFLIQHTVGTAVRRRRADLIKLRAIGATRWLVIAAILVEATLIGALGSLLGVAAGIGFAKLAVSTLGDAVSVMYASLPPPPVTLTTSEFAAALSLGLGTVLVAALIPCAQLVRLRPLLVRPAIQPGAPSVPTLRIAVAGTLALAVGVVAVELFARSFGLAGGIGVIAFFAACVFLGTTLLVPAFLLLLTPALGMVLRWRWGILGAWMWKQVCRHQYHTATTMGALAAAVAFTTGLTTLLGSYRSAVAPWITQTLAADIFIIAGTKFSLLSGPTLVPELRDQIAAMEGVTRVMPWRFVQVQFRDKPIIVQSAPEQLIERWHPEVLRDARTADAVIISDTLAERFGLDVGDELAVPAPVAPLALRVGAVAPDYLLDLGNLTVPWDRFVSHFGDQHANMLFIDCDPKMPVSDLKQKIEAIVTDRYDATVLTGNELRAMMNALIDQSFALTTALQFLAVLVTVLAMINATTATVLDRAFELATWRAIGLERGRLVRLLVVEASLLGLLAGILGLGSGALIGEMLVRVVAPAVAGFRLPLTWPTSWALTAVALTMVFAGMTAALVARTQTTRAIVLRDLRP